MKWFNYSSAKQEETWYIW